MAIDGVGIIDSDCAHDVYNPIMEMYHLGQSIESIRNNMDAFKPNFIYSQLEHEIFITTYALAMWEIGGLTNEQLEKVKCIVSKGVSKLWNEIDKNEQADRQKILNKFLKKIE